MNSDFVDSSKRQTFNPSDRRKLNDLNLIRNDPINPRKALDFKPSPYGDIQTNRNQNRYSAPSLNNPRARYSTEYDHRFSTEIPVNAAHPQNDSAYKLERIRQNIGGSNGAALNRYSQGSTDALGSPKTDKQKENARNVVTRAVSQKMLSENSGSQPNLHLFEQESQLRRSPGVNDRNSGVFYGHPVAGTSGMTAARSHQNLAHIGGFAQPTIYSPNDRRSSQPGSPMSPVSPILPVNHFTGGAPHPAFNGVPITPYGLNSPDSASISSDSPSQDQPRVPTINNPYQQNRAHLPPNYVQKQPATSKPPPYSQHMASNYQSTNGSNGSTFTLPQKLVPPNVKMRPKPSNMGVKMNNRVSCPVPPPQYCNWTSQSPGQSFYEKRPERALSGMDFCPRTSDPFMDIDNISRPTSGYDSDYRVGSQTSSECASDLQSGIGINQDWADESSTVFNMNHVKGPPAYLAMETRSDYASSENSSYLGMDDKKYSPHQNGFNNDSVVTIRQAPGAHSHFQPPTGTNDVTMRSPTTSPNQSTDYAIRQHAEEKKKKSKGGIFSLFRKDSESSKTTQNATPSITEKITSSMATATLDEKDKNKPRKRVFKTIREVPPRAFKFYMEQRIDNLMKAANERIERKRGLEAEMCGQINSMTERDRDVMRQMLRKKETQHLRLTRRKMNIDQFITVKQLGKGAFGTVSLVRKKDSGAYYALKMLNKKEVVQRKQIAHVKAERDILKEADNDWIVKLYYSFQDEEHLYFALEYIPGGDLMALLIRKHIFKKPLSQFYTAELVQAVASVHEMGFIHRDIKPDNVLIGRDGHIKLTDFGLCTGFRWTHDSDFYKPGSQTTNRLYDRKNMLHRRKQACSVVGTPNYIAPEVLRANGAPGQGYTKSCDWWSVGVILFEMIIGQPPFAAQTPLQTQEMILAHTHTFQIPHTCPCPRARALMQSWIVGEENRLSDPMLIRNHPFFAEINWQTLRFMKPPFIPTITGMEDTSNFDPVEPDMSPSPPENEADPNHTLHQAAFVEFTFRRFFDQDGIPRTQQQTQSRPVPRRQSAAHPPPPGSNSNHPHGPVRGWP